jgi:hypothetical protein
VTLFQAPGAFVDIPIAAGVGAMAMALVAQHVPLCNTTSAMYQLLVWRNMLTFCNVTCSKSLCRAS